MAKEFWEDDAPASAPAPAASKSKGDKAPAFWESDTPASKGALPADVKPSTAAGGRGSVNPDLPIAATAGAELVGQTMDPNTGMMIGVPASVAKPADTRTTLERSVEALPPQSMVEKIASKRQADAAPPMSLTPSTHERADMDELRGGMYADSNPVVRVGAKVVAGIAQGLGGVAQAAGDVTGIEPLARAGKATAEGAQAFQKGMGDGGDIAGFGPKSPVPYLRDMGEGAATSLGQSVVMAGTGGARGVIALQAIQQGGQSYNEARQAGHSPAEALARAIPQGAFEAIGEKFQGFDKATAALGVLLQKGATTAAKKSAGEALVKAGIREVPGELLTTIGQDATDIIPGIGLNPDMTMGQFLDDLRDTVVQTTMMGGAMAGAGHHVAKANTTQSAADLARSKGFLVPSAPLAATQGQTAPTDPAAPVPAPVANVPPAAAPVAPPAPAPVIAAEPPKGTLETAAGTAPILAQGGPVNPDLANMAPDDAMRAHLAVANIEAQQDEANALDAAMAEDKPVTRAPKGKKATDEAPKAEAPAPAPAPVAADTAGSPGDAARAESPESTASAAAPLSDEVSTDSGALPATTGASEEAPARPADRNRDAKAAPGAAPAKQTFASVEEASDYVRQQRARGTNITAAPFVTDDGEITLATKGSPEYERALDQRQERIAKKAQADAGVLDGDILTKGGAPFKARVAATRALKEAGDGHQIVEVKGGFVVRKGADVGNGDGVRPVARDGDRSAGADAASSVVPTVGNRSAADGAVPGAAAPAGQPGRAAAPASEQPAPVAPRSDRETVKSSSGGDAELTLTAPGVIKSGKPADTNKWRVTTRITAGSVVTPMRVVGHFDTEAEAQDAYDAEKARVTGQPAPKVVNKVVNPAPEKSPKVVNPAPAAGPEIVVHTTPKGKEIRGVVRTDLTKEQAQAIDPYTMKKNGGWFIREKHIDQLPAAPTVEAPDAPAPKADMGNPTSAAPEQTTLEGFDVIPADPKVFAEALSSMTAELAHATGDGERLAATFGTEMKPVSLPRVTKSNGSPAGLPFVSTEEAAKRLQSWKDEADRQGREHLSANAQRTVISLFDVSGVISQPWVDAGYNVVTYDLQHGDDINDFNAESLLERHGNDEVWAILAQPPCTDYASSGAQWWKDKDADGRTEASNELVRQTLRTIELFRPAVWAMENPVGRIATQNNLPTPTLAFDPWAYGDPYTKRTQLWGRFDNNLPQAPVEPVEGSKIHRMSSSAKNERSLTPEGFAYAFFMANNAEGKSEADRLAAEFAGVDPALFAGAIDAGHSAFQIRNAIEDAYYDSDLETVRTELASMGDKPRPPTLDEAAHEAATSPHNSTPEPTQAQKEAGNYKMGHITVQGLDVSVENPQGSVRRGVSPDGVEWSNEMSHHYGYVKGTEAADGDHHDVYIGPKAETAKTVYVVDQIDQKTGGFDETKSMIGFASKAAAVTAYKKNFDAGWKVGPVTAMSMDEFKAFIADPVRSKMEASKAMAISVEAKTVKPAALPAPKRETKAARAAREAEEARAAYFTPGNVIRAYDGFDRVVSYQPGDPATGSAWSVTVRHVKPAGPGTFEDIPNERDRTHRTQPEPRLLKNGPIARMAAPEAVSAPARALDAAQDSKALRDQAQKYIDAAPENATSADEYDWKAGTLTAKDLTGTGITSEGIDPSKSDLTRPVIVSYGDGEATPILVWDGVHRIGSAIALGRGIPAIIGTRKAETVEEPAAPTQPDAATQRAEHAAAQAKKAANTAKFRAAAWAKNPMWAFLGKHGLPLSMASTWAPGLKERRSAIVSGFGPIFRKNALNIDLLAQAAVEEGFLAEPDADKLYGLITDAFGGKRVIPQFTAEAAEDEMADRLARHQAFEDDAADAVVDRELSPSFAIEAADDSEIPWDTAPAGQADNSIIQALRDMGATEQEIQDEIAAEAARAQSRDSGRAGLEQGAAESAQAGSERGAGQEPAAGAAAEHREDGAGEGVADRASADGFELERPTADEVVARQAAAEAAEKKAAERRKRDEQRAQADDELAGFTLTGSDRAADVAASRGQGDIFSAPAAEEAPASGTKIEDFGEELAGARKMTYTAAYKDKFDKAAELDVSAEPLSKTWPEPDYKKLLEAGADPWAVAFARAARDEVPTKPSKSWKLNGWTEKVKSLRDLAQQALSDAARRESMKAELNTARFATLRGWVDGKVALYEALGHEHSLKDYELSSGSYSMHGGIKFDPPKSLWSVTQKKTGSSWGKEMSLGNTMQEALDAFVAKAPEIFGGPAKPRTTTFEIYSKRGAKENPIFIGKKIGRNVITIKAGFATVKEARAFMADNAAELESTLAKMKEIPPERNAIDQPRVGADHRQNGDVSPEQFSDAFGFRGVQFGNYVEGDRRQRDLNRAYDSLMDLAAMIGVPPRALSLNGSLGLAFGARGKGGKNAAAAHYESGEVVINLTKDSGAGSLAHEWWHAMDNYFGKQDGRPSAFPSEDPGATGPMRAEMREAFRGVKRTLQTIPMKGRSAKLDELRSKPYWSTPLEMSARAFEGYVVAKLNDQGARNDFLANIVSEPDYALEGGYPYPVAAEMPQVRAAFDHFLATIQHRPGDDGKVELFDRAGSMAPAPVVPSTLSTPERVTKAEKLLARLARSERVRVAFRAVEPSEAADPVLKQTLAAVRTVAKRVFGHDVVFVQFDGPPIFNGVVSTAIPNTVFLRIDSAKPHMSVLGHELMHQLARSNPVLYKALGEQLDALTRDGAKSEFAQDLQARSEKVGMELPEHWEEEMHADIVGDFFTDPKFWSELAKGKPTLFQRLSAAIVKFLDSVKQALLTTSPDMGTKAFLTDIDAARAAVVGAMRQFVHQKMADPATAPDMLARSEEASDPEAAALHALSKVDELYRLPKSSATTVEGVAHDINPELKVRKLRSHGDGRQDYLITLTNGNQARIMVRSALPESLGGNDQQIYGHPDDKGEEPMQIGRPGVNPQDVANDTSDVYLDVSLLSPGQSGDEIYAIAAAFAHNTGRIFIGDPAGLSDEAMRRRLEQMISSALKYGTTAHLAPHPRQVAGAAGVPPLKWVYGDHAGNVERMIEASVKAMDNAFPASNTIEFDSDTGNFRRRDSGAQLRSQQLAVGLGRAVALSRAVRGGPASKAQAGWRTLARAALFRRLLDDARSGAAGSPDGRPAGILGALRSHVSDLGAASKDERIFYDRAAAADSDVGAAAQASPELSRAVFGGSMEWSRDEHGKAVKVDELKKRYAKLTQNDKAKMLLAKRIVTEDQLKRWQASKLDIFDGAVNRRFEQAFLSPGVVWNDAELKSQFSMTPEQIAAYRDLRTKADTSIAANATADMLRLAGVDAMAVREQMLNEPMDVAAETLRDHLLTLADVDPARKDQLIKTANRVIDIADLATDRMESGYVPDQVKPDVRPNGWEAPAPSKIDRLIYEFQDNKIDLKRTQEAIAAAGATIDERFDARLAETLYSGRVAKRSQLFVEREVQPLLRMMARMKVSQDDLGDYLHARGASERNAQVAKVNPDMPDGGAGRNSKGTLMTDANAAAYLAALPAARRAQLFELAQKVDAITAGTRQLLVSSGLEKAETIAAWEGAYKNYVPMFREDVEFRRITVHKRATGSESEAVHILSHVLMQREGAISRAERNQVLVSLYGLALSNPNTDFWATIRPAMDADDIKKDLVRMGIDPTIAEAGMQGVPTITDVDPVTGKVAQRLNPMYKSLPGAIVLKVNGEYRVLMMNQENPRALRMAESLKNADGLTRFDLSTNIIGKTTRWLAAVNTQYNPIFGMVNFVRDTMAGVIHLGSTEIGDKKIAVIRGLPGALAGIAAHEAGRTDSGKWSRLFEQFQQDGGETGFRDMVRDGNERAQRIEDALKHMDRSKMDPRQVAHLMMELLSGFNTVSENAVRLSAYAAALDKGISRANAARLAKELTVDFNRKGRATRELGPLYAFFNASIQGTERTLRALRGPGGQKIIYGGIALGLMQAIMLASAGYDDDEIPDFVKARALIIPMFDKERRFISIPLPVGLNVLPNTGRVIGEMILGDHKHMGKKAFDAIGEIAGAMNPLGGGNIFTADGALKTLAPTVVDPFIELAANKNFAGYQIEREARGEGDNRPGFQRAREGTTRQLTGQAYIGIAKAMNRLTGGTDFEAGAVSPTPERLRYLAQTAGGGVVRETEKILNAIAAKRNGQDLPMSAVPVAGRFFGEIQDGQVTRSRYYRAADEIDKTEQAIKAARKAGDGATVERLLGTPEAQFINLGNKVAQRLSKLNKMAVAEVGDKTVMKAIDDARTAEMHKLTDNLIALEKAQQGPTLADKVRKAVTQ